MRRHTSYLKYLLVIIALLLRIVNESTANMSYFVLALYALFGLKEAIQALALSWLFGMLSLGIAPFASLGALGRYVIVLAAAASVFFRYEARLYQAGQKRIILSTIVLGIVLLAHSLLFSVVPDVSILKVISWTITATTLFAAWGGLSQAQSSQLIRQLFAGLTAVMLVSLPLLVQPLGYLRNDSGFQGILNHPQVFGPVMALLGAWVAMRLLTLPRPPWKMALYIGVCVALIVLSEARTAGFALAGGVFSSIVISVVSTRQRIAVLFPGLRSARINLVIFCLILASLVYLPQLVSTMDTYVSKRQTVEGIIESYQESRGGLVEPMLDNIKKRPMTGIGFGIASDHTKMKVTRDPIFGMPVGASIEKGVLPIAVVEEVGVIGLLYLLLWGKGILGSAQKSGDPAIALLGTIILLNFGESTFFSIGGSGMLSLLLLGWIATVNSPAPERNNA